MTKAPVIPHEYASWLAGYRTTHAGEPKDIAATGFNPLTSLSGVIEGNADLAAGRVASMIREIRYPSSEWTGREPSPL